MCCRKLQIGVCTIVAALLTACGTPGVPVPPSLELARPVTDLRASRKGDNVYLTWTMPTHTTERQNLRHGGVVAVCRAIGREVKDCATPVARIPFQPPSRNATPQLRNYTDQLPPSLQAPPTSQLDYAISVLNRYGRSAGLSNQIEVPSAPALPAASGFRAQLNGDGVHLSWEPVSAPDIPGLRFLYRIYRRNSATNQDTIAGELPVAGQPSPGLIDNSFEWEKTYEYRATVVTIVNPANKMEQQLEGEDTTPVRVVMHDVFPPAAPTGLQAVFSGPGQKPFIDLVWTPNTETDLAGYNVYRHEADKEEWSKLNSDLIKSPAYRDSAIEPGHRYSYSVSAVDIRGNESPHSAEARESVPEQ
jgi:hypothetical protein